VGLVNFNDRLCASVSELRSVIMKARALALEDAEAALAAAAMERKLLAEVECYRAARVSSIVTPLVSPWIRRRKTRRGAGYWGVLSLLTLFYRGEREGWAK